MNVPSELLVQLLQKPLVYCAVINRFAEPEASHYLRKQAFPELPGLPFKCFSMKNGVSMFPPSPQNDEKLLYYYAMDLASIYPVLALCPHSSDEVLDMCAAPGGKAFTLLQMVKSKDGGALALNDSNASRAQRLRHVVRKCVTKSVLHSVRITRRKGEEWGIIERNVYDKVLVDAPCSSDRHNIEKWVKKNKYWPDSMKFRRLQSRLLQAAVHAVKDKGIVVYSTCTMSTEENDAVIHDVMDHMQKCGYGIEVVDSQTPCGEIRQTEFGKLILPSATLNIGPMFLSKLQVTQR